MRNNLVQINNNSVEFKENNGKVYVSSRDIATVFGKKHYSIIRDIKALPQDEFNQLNFELVEYTDAQGKKRPEYLLTRDGFSLLVMGFTGEKAYQWKISFINAFNEMEKALKDHAVEKMQQPTIDPAVLGAERAKIILSIANNYRDKYDGRYAQILDSYAMKELTGEHVLPLPELPEKYYSAAEVGKLLGISANKVGRLANTHKLKNEQYGKWFADKSPYSTKEVQTFKYNSKFIETIELLNSTKGA